MSKIQGKLFWKNKREYPGVNLIQFIPYFPPHKWWVETVAEELSTFYVKNWYWEVINVVFDVWQDIFNPSLTLPLNLMEGENKEYIKNNFWKIIWYKKNWYLVYLLPSFDLVFNFPFPKFWKKEFWEILKIVWNFSKNEKTIIQTHTRFFLSSFLWWLFAKFYKLKWVHIEHWSEYVMLWSKLKSKIAYFYDKIIWVWIFRYSDKIVAISNWVKKFVENEFVKNKEIEIIYNWIDFKTWEKTNNWNIIKIWYVWRLVKLKWVNLLLEAFKNLALKYENIQLEIVWDWDEKIELEKFVKENNLKNIKFLWFQNREYIANNFLPNIDILVNPSFQEWLPTVVLEWLLSKCVVVATDVWWTKEISNLNDLIIIQKWSIKEIEIWLEKAILTYKEVSWISFQNVSEKFDWNENIKKYFSLYNKLNLKNK